jgi:PAS domain S-box-containing protein
VTVDAADLLDAAPCGFVSFHDDGGIALINATLLQQLGYAREELLGRHVETILAVGSRIFYQTHLFPLVKLHGRAQEVFLLLRTKGGEAVGALCNAARRERDGAYVTDCVLMEVRERRKYEDALLQAKREAEEARAAVEVHTRELENANRQLEEQALEVELQHKRLQEQAAELEAQGEALQLLNGALMQRSAELERQRTAADEANRAKSNFLAVMSHELRTPLNAIGGYVQLLDMGVHGPITEAQRGALERIDRSQRHLLRLVNDVLNLARIEAGRVDYTVEAVPLAEVVRSVMPMIEPQIAAKGLRWSASVPPQLVARADREKVQQILLNLLTNAVKFTGAGGRVTVEAVEDASRPGGVLLRVADTGIGIPPSMVESIFEPFVQVDASHTRPVEGSGLGLAISRDLARGMGGDLTAESEVGQGSTFTVALRRWVAVGGGDAELTAARRED